MHEIEKIKDMFCKLNYILSATQKKYAVLVLLMGMVASVLEMLGIAVLVPVIDMLMVLDNLKNNWFMKPFITFFNLNTTGKLVVFICLLVIIIYLIKNIYFSFYNWVSFKYAYKVRRELSIKILRTYMRQGYIFFVSNNTSRMLQGIGSDVDGVYNIINTVISILTKVMTIVCIGIFIIWQSKDMAVVLLMLSVLCLVVIQAFFRKRMRQNGIIRRNLQYETNKTSIEAIQGNKEILVMHKQDFFVDHYSEMLAKLYRVSTKVDLGTVLPAYIIEMICVCGVMLAVVLQFQNLSEGNIVLTQLATIAAGAFRILPALGAIMSGVNIITMNTTQLQAAYETLEGVRELEQVEVEKKKKSIQYQGIQFTDALELRDISYQYPGSKEPVINGINLRINKGESVAFIGTSGAGKTTLSDIILALLKPTRGQILIDGIDVEDIGEEWSKIIGYVPQMIYIIDDTIKKNIAFGDDEDSIDEEKIWEALKIAQLDDYVKGLPHGINTIVGERGIRFSGGQRQRIAIARALYRNPEILVLDEATAALDNETETEVMKAIEALQGYKTLIIVAHRLTTVRKCDKIYEVIDGKTVYKDKKDILNNIVH